MMTPQCLFIAMALFSTAALAQAPQHTSPADYLFMILAQDQIQSEGVVGPLLDYPFFSDADKEVLRKAVKPMDDAIAAMKKNAANNPTIESIQADQAKVVQSSYDMLALLNSGGRSAAQAGGGIPLLQSNNIVRDFIMLSRHALALCGWRLCIRTI